MNMPSEARAAFDFSAAIRKSDPFRYVRAENVLSTQVAGDLLSWLRKNNHWKKQNIDGFYETENINLREVSLPPALVWLTSNMTCDFLRSMLHSWFGLDFSRRVDISAHQLKPGYRIRAHTDHGPVGQTHRLLLQLNTGWCPENGGLLLLLRSGRPSTAKDVAAAICPLSRSFLVFEVSPASHHAVTPVSSGDRYTIVYSFYAR